MVPSDLAELSAMYRSVTVDKRMLVVLDDALTAAQVAPLLPSSPESLTVVTTRTRLGGLAARGARIIQVGGLDADAALELLTDTIGDDRPRMQPHAARKLVDLCTRLPLALVVAGARLAARPNWPVSEMAAAMIHERERLAALTLEGDVAVRSALDLSYRALPDDAARTYRRMGLFPGTYFDSSVAAAALTAPRAEAKRLLGTLADANMLDDAELGQYRFHDLTRLHAREKADREEPESVHREVIRRMLDWFLATAGSASRVVTPHRAGPRLDLRYPPAEAVSFTGTIAALDWLERELADMLAAARLAADLRLWSVTWQLADLMWPVFLHRGRHAAQLEFDRLGLDAARADGDSTGEARMLYRIGLSAMNVGEHDQAEAYTRQAMVAWQRLGRRDRVAGSQRRFGFIEMARHRPGNAIDRFTQALAMYRRLSDARHVALTLTDLADAFIETGHHEEAVAALEEAKELLADSGDHNNQARVLTRLGRAHLRGGQLERAAGYLDQALGVARDIGSARSEADTLASLGDVAVRLGRNDEAFSRYTQARRILASPGSPADDRIQERLIRLGPVTHQ
jgi:tetratricopeptide (TPR) repeat protein